MQTEQKAGAAATVAILAAIGGYILVCTGRPVLGLIAQVVAIIGGAIGVMVSASPRVGGGLMSVGAIVLGLIGVVVAILGTIGVILT